MLEPLRLLAEASLVAAPQAPLKDDAELGEAARQAGFVGVARTLSNQLQTRPAGMERWARLDRYGKALAAVCANAVHRTVNSPASTGLTGETGLVVASLNSCTETNARFDHQLLEKGPERASPLLFPYTLPGAAASEVAMHLHFGGPYLIFAGPPSSALAAFLSAADLIASGHPCMVVAAVDVLGAATLQNLPPHDPSEQAARMVRPFGAGEVAAPLAEGAQALVLGHLQSNAYGSPFGMCASISGPLKSPSELNNLLNDVVKDSGLPKGQLTRIINASTSRASVEGVNEWAKQLSRGPEVLHLAWKVGNAGAALGLFAVSCALQEGGASLVLATDEAATVLVLIHQDA